MPSAAPARRCSLSTKNTAGTPAETICPRNDRFERNTEPQPITRWDSLSTASHVWASLARRVDADERLRRFFERGKPEQSFTVGQERARAGVLHDGWLAAGEIAERPVADPGVLERHTGRLRTAEFPA